VKNLNFLVLGVIASLVLVCVPAIAQTNTNGSPSYTPATPNNVSIPGMPTMYVNGGGANKAGQNFAQWLHDWGKYGIDAAKACDRAEALKAIAALQSDLNSTNGAYDAATKAGQDASEIANDAAVEASIINYIRLALSACKVPEHAMMAVPDHHVAMAAYAFGGHHRARVTEDNPAYMENYRSPQTGQTSSPRSNANAGEAASPPPDQQTGEPHKPDLPQPPTTMPN
jgi:hypothetical protein